MGDYTRGGSWCTHKDWKEAYQQCCWLLIPDCYNTSVQIECNAPQLYNNRLNIHLHLIRVVSQHTHCCSTQVEQAHLETRVGTIRTSPGPNSSNSNSSISSTYATDRQVVCGTTSSNDPTVLCDALHSSLAETPNSAQACTLSPCALVAHGLVPMQTPTECSRYVCTSYLEALPLSVYMHSSLCILHYAPFIHYAFFVTLKCWEWQQVVVCRLTSLVAWKLMCDCG
jgi:hypothetical protein